MFKREGITKETKKSFAGFKREVKENLKQGTIDTIFFKYPRVKVIWVKVKGYRDIVKITQGYNWGVTPAEGAWVNPKDWYLEPICGVKSLEVLEVTDVNFEGDGWMQPDENVIYHLYTYQTAEEIDAKLETLQEPARWATPQKLQDQHKEYLLNLKGAL